MTDELIETARKRYAQFVEIYQPQFDEVIDDLQHLDGNQWDKEMLTEREADGRPCFTINKLPKFLDQVVGEQRQNRQAIKVKPVGGKASKDVAKILSGLIRNIELVSDADVAYDHAFEHGAAAGIGAWRILNQYASADSFDQDIWIKPIWNALNIAWDPDSQDYYKADARWMMLLSKSSREAFEAEYPDSQAVGFDTDETYDQAWGGQDYVTVAEYFTKEKTKRTIYQIKDAQGDIDVIDRAPDPDQGEIKLHERTVEVDKIMWRKITGKDTLEGPIEIPGDYIPIVLFFGKQLNIKGVQKFRGIVRFQKDPQKLYNYARSHGAELVALAPKAPYMMTPAMIQGHTSQWQDPKRNYPYYLYNPDPAASVGYPKREDPPQASSAVQEQIMMADSELNDTSGISEAGLGEKSNEKSGKAILARQAKTQIGNFAYIDNLARAKKHTGKILISMIPKIYDTERVIRVIHEDGTDEEMTVNQIKAGTQEILNDITVGRYDVTVDVGPSYQTRQDEAGESMLELMGVYPAAAPFIADLVVGSMTWPKADMIAERLKKLLPPGIAEEQNQEQPPGGPGTQPGATSTPGQAQAAAGAPNQPGTAAPQQQMSNEEMAMAAAMAENQMEMAEVKLAQEKAQLKKIEAEAALAELKVRDFGREDQQQTLSKGSSKSGA